MPAMIISANFFALGQYKRILITMSTIWSTVSNSEQPSADFVLGDGSAAMVLTPSGPGFGIHSFDMQTDGRFYYNCGSRFGDDHKKKYYEKHNTKMLFYIDNEGLEGPSSSFARYLLTNGPSTFKASLKKAGLTPDDIDCALIHGNVTPVVRGWIKGMKVPRERIPLTYNCYGNLSCVTVPANLREALDKGMIKRAAIRFLLSARGPAFQPVLSSCAGNSIKKTSSLYRL